MTILKVINQSDCDKHSVIIADTVKGKGIKFMENVPKWHSLAPKGKDAERAKKEIQEKLDDFERK